MAPPEKKRKVVAVYSEKGGVGKSGLAGGLTAVAQADGRDVIAGDLDPRASLTAELGVDEPEWSINDLLYVDPEGPLVNPRGLASDALTPASAAWPGVRVLASERALAHREIDGTAGMELRLKLALEGVIEDLGILDIPPRAGGKLVSAALAAATHVLIPATLDADGIIGAREAMKTVSIVQQGLNPDLVVLAVVPSIVPTQLTQVARESEGVLLDEHGSLYRKDLTIPRHAVRQTSRYASVPIHAVSDPKSPILTAAYRKVLKVVDAA
ncbi:chromosome partitioning protein [Streptomyces sp. 2321.6]|uniref:ParA family protein n=1 Tax=Streptomyces sp. 2321.6 TaxID=1938840 RepID=UPI000BC715BE|nr:ParA family protein [Streptomyces sp. 2321.6]PBC72409.1 chromosome partitioning protein [Streptomyces sp. 2321.6]